MIIGHGFMALSWSVKNDHPSAKQGLDLNEMRVRQLRVLR